ncbi:hypothetical protein JOE48_004145 [Methylobacterium sp. PvR107]|nr:hypothetical protein [Methylobacterium sp. PvR107]
MDDVAGGSDFGSCFPFVRTIHNRLNAGTKWAIGRGENVPERLATYERGKDGREGFTGVHGFGRTVCVV